MLQENTDVGEKFDDALRRALYGTVVVDDYESDEDDTEDEQAAKNRTATAFTFFEREHREACWD